MAYRQARREKTKNDVQEENMLMKRVKHPAKNARVGVFVDVQNMFYSAKEYYDGKVDF